MLVALGCKLAAVEDMNEPKLYLAVHCANDEEGDHHTVEIMTALLASDREFRRELRLGRWRGRLLPCGAQLLFWDGVVVSRRRTVH